MFSRQAVRTGAIAAVITCVLCIPVVSLAGESLSSGAADAEQNIAVTSEAKAADKANPVMPDLKRAGKSDPKEQKDDKKAADGKDSASDGKQTRKVAHTLTAVKPRAKEETVKEKEAPLPSDAIIGVRGYKRHHLDIPTERLIASLGEQARYIGQKDGIPASILLARTINNKGTHLSEDTPYRVYGVFLESSARNMAAAYERRSGASMAAGEWYGSVLGKLQSAGVMSAEEASSIIATVERYELDRFDTPLAYKVIGTIYDEGADKVRDLQMADYVNLERVATAYIGTPYVWGGSTELTGFDCSGLVQWTYEKALGITLPRTTYVQQYVGESVPVDIDELRMGDLLFFYTPSEGTHHVAMYLADGYYIHAPCSGDVVKITSIEEYAPTFARRIANFEKI